MSVFESIAWVARSESRLIMLDVARRVKVTTGAKIYLFCFGPQEMRFYKERNTEELFADVIDAEVLLSSSKQQGLDESAVMARAEEIEAELPRNYNSVVIANRHLGRGYAQGGFYHPRSRYSETTSYTQVVHAYNECFSFWEGEFARLNITMVVNGTVEAAVVAQKMGLPFRVLCLSRHKNFHFWAHNEFYEDTGLAEAYQKRLQDVTDRRKADAVEPYMAHLVNRTAFVKSASTFKSMVKNIGLQIARHIYWRLRRYAKAKSYYLTSEIAYYYRVWAQNRQLARLGQPLSSVSGRKFVFFPLHLEPEIALQGLSPEYFFQLTSIACISRDLPAGVVLAVKETFAGIGRRPDNFYRQIADLKNVVLLDTMEFGAEVVKEASAVVTINGTAGLEAAQFGKPVIAFGQHNNYACMDHVHVVEDIHSLRDILAESLQTDAAQIEDNAECAAVYMETVLERSFDLGGYDYVKVSDYSVEAVEAAADALVSGFQQDATAVA